MKKYFRLDIIELKKFFSTLILGCHFLLILFFYMAQKNIRPLIFIAINFLSVLALVYSQMQNFKLKLNTKTIINVFALILSVVFVQVINSTIGFRTVYIPIAVSFAFFIYKSRFNIFTVYVIISIIAVILIYKLLVLTNINDIFVGASRNYVSAIMLVIVSTAYIVIWQQKKYVSLYPAFIALFASLLSLGRSGIISSLYLLSGIIYIKYFQQVSFTKRIINFVLIATPLVVLISLLNIENLSKYLTAIDYLERFADYGMESSGREKLWRYYIDNINLKTFLIGYDFTNHFYFIGKKLNPHNSYISLHYRLGILFIPILVTMVFALIHFYKREKLYFFILSSLMLRAMTDRIFFLNLFDFILILILIIYFKDRMTAK